MAGDAVDTAVSSSSMVDALPLRIFLASPGDLADEREVVRACVDEHNVRRTSPGHITYEVVGWERVRGTARRPQEAINELIEESHFLVTLFKGSWGSQPGSPWGYTSGTEEELFTGLLELGRPEQPMRDVWVAFLDHPSPADEIQKLRQQMSRRHSMMYESIEDIRELKERLTDRLVAWEASAGSKVHRHVDLLPSSGKDVLRAARLRLHGEKLVELGQAEAGRTALREAAILGGPVEQLSYARFLARQGDLEQAHASTQQAIDYFASGASALFSPLAAEAFAAQAGVLRRQGRDVDAIGRLEQALTLLDESDAYAQKVRCRILDDLGLAHQRTGDLASARRDFEAALESRRASGDDLDVCQSLVNLARLEVRAGNLETAATHANEVVACLRGTPPTALNANAEVLAAQVRLRQGRPDEGLPYAERALSLNQQIASRRGEAISLLLLAQCCRAAGMDREAREHARACLEVNKSMGDEEGVRRAQWILDQLAE
jgi:tetratricopeptide (TPR) repeat protein